MLHEKKQQAKELFFQTDLSKTQIANLLGISRRSLHYWVKDEHWDRLRESATQLPALLAEKCYHIFGHLTDQYLSELRATKPITHKEADTLHKLVITINKLKNRSTLNENIETFSYFLEGLKKQAPELAQQVTPYIDKYLTGRASIFTSQLAPANYNNQGLIPLPETDITEQQLDTRDLFDWDNEHMDANPDLYPTMIMSLPNDMTIPDELDTSPSTAPDNMNLPHRRITKPHLPTGRRNISPLLFGEGPGGEAPAQHLCNSAQESSKNPTLQKT